MFHNRRILGVVRRPAVVGGGADPPGIFGANLVAWWAPEDGLPSGVAPDKSGNGRTLTAAGSPAVTAVTGFLQAGGASGGFPGKPIYSYTNDGSTGTGGLFAGGSAGAHTFPALGGAGAVFMAISANIFNAPFAEYFTIQASGQANVYDNLSSIETFLNNATPAVTMRCNLVQSTAPITEATAHIYCFAWDASTMSLYEDNVLKDSDAPGGTINIGAGSATSFALGGRLDQAPVCMVNAQVGDAFVVNVTPNSTQRTSAYNYLKTKFGL